MFSLVQKAVESHGWGLTQGMDKAEYDQNWVLACLVVIWKRWGGEAHPFCHPSTRSSRCRAELLTPEGAMTQDKGVLAFPDLVVGTSPPALPHTAQSAPVSACRHTRPWEIFHVASGHLTLFPARLRYCCRCRGEINRHDLWYLRTLGLNQRFSKCDP